MGNADSLWPGLRRGSRPGSGTGVYTPPWVPWEALPIMVSQFFFSPTGAAKAFGSAGPASATTAPWIGAALAAIYVVPDSS